MFTTPYSAQRSEFDAMANAWLGAGASSVSIWTEAGMLDRWPIDAEQRSPDFVAPIRIGTRTRGELRVVGLNKAQKVGDSATNTQLLYQPIASPSQFGSLEHTKSFSPYYDDIQVPGIHVYAESRPALQLGGDYVDVVYQPEKNLFFTVSDVSGKGCDAAMFTPSIYNVIRAGIKALPQPTPQRLMGYANQDMYAEFSDSGRFATTFIGQYDPAGRRLRYANAGHSPVIYRPADGRIRFLNADGPPIGIQRQNTCVSHDLSMGPGDLLIVATDGFAESRNRAGQMFGYQRLLHLADSLADASPRTIVRSLFKTVRAFRTGRTQDDDQTLLVIKGRRNLI